MRLPVHILLVAWGTASCSAPTRPASPASPPALTQRASARKNVETSAVQGPRIRILGTAQDGGFPHAACERERCQHARTTPEFARYIASIGILDNNKRYLVDATPDIRPQLDLIADLPPSGAVNRMPVDGVLLTHAHIGHYLGLAFFGFEAVHTQALPVFASPAMGNFLRTHAPWQQLVRIKNLELQPVTVGHAFVLPGTDITATALAVPHRDEYADTMAWRFSGPREVVLYVPDCDPWPRWNTDPNALFEGVTLALVDGTFFSMDELPGRDLTKIGHPLMTQTMDLVQDRVDAKTLKLRFVHLNHSNPAIEADSPERKQLLARGFDVAEDGQEFAL